MASPDIYGMINLTFALLITLFSIPLVAYKIKMNHIYGVRIPQAYQSDRNWYEINAYGGKQFILWSLPMVLIGLLCLYTPYHLNSETGLILLCGIAPIFVCIAGAMIDLRRFVKQNLT